MYKDMEVKNIQVYRESQLVMSYINYSYEGITPWDYIIGRLNLLQAIPKF